MVEVFSFLDLLFAGDRSAFLSCGPSSRLASFLGVKWRRPLSLRSFGLQNSLQRRVHSSESYCVVTVAVVVFACGLRFQTSGGPSMSVPWSLSGNRSSVISVSAAFGIVGFVSARLSLSFFSPACLLLGGSPPSMFVRRGLLELVLVLRISTRRLKWFVVESAMYCFIVGGSCSDWLSQRHCCFSWTVVVGWSVLQFAGLKSNVKMWLQSHPVLFAHVRSIFRSRTIISVASLGLVAHILLSLSEWLRFVSRLSFRFLGFQLPVVVWLSGYHVRI